MRVDPTQLAAKAGEIILTLSKEGDRGCVLVAAVLLEQAIESSGRPHSILHQTFLARRLLPCTRFFKPESTRSACPIVSQMSSGMPTPL